MYVTHGREGTSVSPLEGLVEFLAPREPASAVGRGLWFVCMGGLSAEILLAYLGGWKGITESLKVGQRDRRVKPRDVTGDVACPEGARSREPAMGNL